MRKIIKWSIIVLLMAIMLSIIFPDQRKTIWAAIVISPIPPIP